MDKFKVEFTREETGYVEIFAENEDDAIKRSYSRPWRTEVVETSDCEYNKVKLIKD